MFLGKIKFIQVQYYTDPYFKQNVINKRISKKIKITLKGLQKQTVYYVRAGYVGSSGVSMWSKVKRVATK